MLTCWVPNTRNAINGTAHEVDRVSKYLMRARDTRRAGRERDALSEMMMFPAK